MLVKMSIIILFFEMLGNWSFGDFFKLEACTWSWELLTEVWKIPSERLYVTYFGGDVKAGLAADEEAKQIWLNLGVPEERLLPFGMKDNFWEMGDVGPCGPCSEIHFDRIGGRDAAHLVNLDDPDVLEVWNLVFMQFNREKDHSLKNLPNQHIDTGMGLERIVSVLQGVSSNYDTDLFQPIFKAIQELTGARTYTGKVGAEDVDGLDMAYRVLADHARTLTIALSDGGRPDNVGRGYVLRRILRRGVRYASEKLNAKPGVFAQLVDSVCVVLGSFFPEILKDPDAVKEIINEEETQFLKTLRRGQRLLTQTIAKLPSDAKTLPGDVAWRLYDTYGFPIDLTDLMVEEQGLRVDKPAYEKARAEAHLRSQGAAGAQSATTDVDVHALKWLQEQGIAPTDDAAKWLYSAPAPAAGEAPSMVCSGLAGAVPAYALQSCTATIRALRVGEAFVEEATAGQEAAAILDRTCFYAESGGQIYDVGFLTREEEAGTGGGELCVQSVQLRGGYVLHVGQVEGALRVGDQVQCAVDAQRRLPVMQNHTGTHLLNWGLRKVLGEADQKGSLVAPDRLRFDFTAKKALTVAQVEEVQRHVNTLVAEGRPIYASPAPLASAKSIQGLRAVFGETYPDPVRVVSVGIPIEELLTDTDSDAATRTSVEFCGGTHLLNGGHVGQMVIVAEEAIAKGVRRVVAVTGVEAARAEKRADQLHRQVEDLAAEIEAAGRPVAEEGAAFITRVVTLRDTEVVPALIGHCRRDALRRRLDQLRDQLMAAEKERQAALTAAVLEEAKLLAVAHPEDALHLVHEFGAASNTKAVNLAVRALQEARPNLAVLCFTADRIAGKLFCVCACPPTAVARGLKAHEWVAAVTPCMKGKGGGKEAAAQASGNEVQAVEEALRLADEFAQLRV